MANGEAAPIVRYLRKIVTDPQADRQSDRQLLQQFLSNQDEAAFAALVRRHGSMVLAVCQSILHHEQDAQDASQATFLVLARKAGSIRDQESVGGWLHGVAYRLSLKARKEAAKRRSHESQLQDQGRAKARSRMDDLTWRELREVLHQELSRLPEKNRLPLILCYLEGKTQEEAARQLGWTAATLKGRLDRGRHLLRTRLTRRGLTLSVPLLAAALSRDAASASSPAWLKATAQAAVLFARAESAATLSSQAAAWAQGALKAMMLGKLKIAATLILGFGVLAAGTGVAVYQLPATEEAKATQEKSEAKAKDPGEQRQQRLSPARLDQFGDPLPAEAIARLGTVRLRHAWFINSVAFTPDGKNLVSHAYWDGVRVWDAATGREIRNLLAKGDDWIGGALLSPDGKLVLSLERHQNDTVMRLRNRADLKPVREFAVGHLQHLQLSPDGRILAGLGSQYGPIELWDVATGRQLRSWKSKGEYIWCLTFSHDGKTLATGGADKVIRFWEVATGQMRREILTPNIVSKVALSADGALLASLGMTEEKLGGGSNFHWENRIRIWDVTTGKELRQLRMPLKEGFQGHPEAFFAVTFSPDGKTLLTGGQDSTWRFWDPATGKELRRFALGTKNAVVFAFSPNGKTMAVAGPAIRLFDVASGKEISKLVAHQNAIYSAIIAMDGRTVVTATVDQGIILWDPATGRERARLDADASDGMALASMDGTSTLISSGSDKIIRVWDLPTGKEQRHFQGPASGYRLLDVSPDCKTIALAGTRKTVTLVDIGTGKQLRELTEHKVWVSGAAFTPDGRTLVVWCGDHTAHLWDLPTGRKLRQFSFVEVTGPPQGLPPPVGGDKSSYPYSAAVSPDGRLIAYGTQARFLVLHDLGTGKEVRRVETLPDGASRMAFSPDSKMLAYGGWRDPTVHLVEVATGRERHRLAGHKGPITSLTFSADDKMLISGSNDTTGLVWDLTGQRDAKVRPNTGQDLDACWSDLASEDAARAFQAIRRLVASPSETIPNLREHLKPVPAVDAKRLAGLIADLDSNRFAVRESAEKELEKLGEVAAPACRKALEQKPTAEVRRRLEALLEKQRQEWQNPSSERLRTLRAMEVLEHIATGEAKQVLSSLAKGAPEARLTQEAKASLERLSKR